MDFNTHSKLEGRHALLSPSTYHWINYKDDQKLEARYRAASAAKKGTDLHDLAMRAIRMRVKIARSEPTLCKYVADCVDYGMVVEQPLYYSDNCFGTADAIVFRRNVLRIFDLKTGIIQGSVHQLEVYAAIFCLEYHVDPYGIKYDFRIYQHGTVYPYDVNPDQIAAIMDKIVDSDFKIEIMKEEGL